MTSCSAASLAADEPLAGTAPFARAWLAVEQPGPWGRDALSGARLPAGVGELLRRRAAVPGLQVVLIRRVGAHADAPGPRRVLVAGVSGERPWLQQATAPTAAELPALLQSADLDPEALVAGAAPGWEDAAPVALVCAHARRDRCCATGGRALAAELADLLPVWESSHLGGHRFAPTLVLLPSGLVLGRADRAAVVATLAGRPPADRIRGFSRLQPAQQAAEAAARQAGLPGGAEPLRVVADPAGYRVLGDGTEVLIAVRPQPTARLLSCGGQPEERTELRAEVLEPPMTPAL